MPEGRPDPDALLDRARDEEAHERRGRLKVFLGAVAGVGKTYAMLQAARERKAEGVDVVVGWVDTHGRAETEALLPGLDVLPRRPIEYRGQVLTEFDLDLSLTRRPTLILVDELAHTNAPGSRHAKRWQDVMETAGRRYPRVHHAQHPAPGESERRCCPDHGRHCPRNAPRFGPRARGRGGADRPSPRGSPSTSQGGKGLRPGAGRRGGPELLPEGQPDRPS